MVLEYGVICGFFFVDEEVFFYLCLIGCEEEQIDVVEVYCCNNGLFYMFDVEELIFIDVVEIDLLKIEVNFLGLKCL